MPRMHRRGLLRLLAGAPLVAAQPALANPGALLPRILVIDPGHGGRDPGALGARGTREKDVTLDIALETARQLARWPWLRVRLTREADSTLALPDRVAIAQQAKADLFVSIHADSAPDSHVRGLSAYTLSEDASDDLARDLAHRENLAGGLGLDLSQTRADVADILLDLAARRTMGEALRARQLIVTGAARDLRLLDRPLRSANFAVLRAPELPSVLIETGFLSNPQDEGLLADRAARRRTAAVLARELAAVLSATSVS
jgi:N-acetylmuramoyl-L-alanine amidase